MNNTSSTNNMLINFFNKYIKQNYKFIIGILVIILFFFVGFQIYNFIKLKNINQNSITYFDAIDLDQNNDFYSIMEKLSLNKDFYSILATLEMINFNLEAKQYNEVKNKYLKLLKNNKINSTYQSAIASHAAYNYLNILFETSDISYKLDINEFINYIDENLPHYKGIRFEIKFLLEVADQDFNKNDINDNSNFNEIYKLIMEAEDISSTIKERVNKIYEVQKYK
tara:strand:- start:2211 stop:2885 length:675 start_codon:yes stop_codon:yes gene_type:complete